MIADRTESQRKVILNLGTDNSHSVLDIGCGNGEKTYYISRHVQCAMGIDPDENQINAAKLRFAGRNLDFQVGCGESLKFPAASFSSVFLNESLHHIPVEKQSAAIREAWRVLKPEGRLLITEPINDSGSFEAILKFYHDEREPRVHAQKAIESTIDKEFELASKEEILIEYACENFDDLYRTNIKTKSYANWNESDKRKIQDILNGCDKTPEGDFIIDYFATVWLLVKI